MVNLLCLRRNSTDSSVIRRFISSAKVQGLVSGLLNGDRSSLVRSITLIESSRRDAETLLDHLSDMKSMKNTSCLVPKSKSIDGLLLKRDSYLGYDSSLRIGVAGPPGKVV